MSLQSPTPGQGGRTTESHAVAADSAQQPGLRRDPGTFEAPGPRPYERLIALAVLVLLLMGCVAVLRPFFSAILWAAVLAFALWPANRRLVAWLRGRRSLAAMLITLSIAAALVGPLTIAVANLADDATALLAAGRRWLQEGLPPSPQWLGSIPLLGPRAAEYWNDLARELTALARESPPQPDAATQPLSSTLPESSRLRQTLRALLLWTRSWILTFGLAIGSGVVQVILSLLVLYFLLRDGEAVAQRLAAMTVRVGGARGRQLLDVAGNTVRGVIYGILGTALAQGLMAGIGFLIAGVPGATLLGLLTFLLSVLPIGPPLVWIPVAGWLFHQGRISWGIFMLLWGLGVSSIDNVIKPWIISRGSRMPFLLIFFGVLGGVLTFGFIGVFIGPTLLAVAYRLVEQWSAAVPEQSSSTARP
ncbi:AI-2E family transporter [Fontivita pretiosa]|jgi:predicted PurR-regulated permease PerM|uniref:AI-2E family transporter n=1 Tax=Fontivita pretiosa TaxID=2989684 RepID=UPI003D181BED